MKTNTSEKKPAVKLTKQTIKNLRVKTAIVGGMGQCTHGQTGCG